ncbi:MDR family MFS transporter [Agriterribacter sp.]|uniref:MDR family MFS transporter n=1 Tax=Agriterribacter sp. TaxID=2821509 RepID=UPI002C7D5BA3|nr:MDR family MFS transporter [Agriterribacter sp.]HRP55899.1 MDR family MFS transporter [Agriterribacter sp.]
MALIRVSDKNNPSLTAADPIAMPDNGAHDLYRAYDTDLMWLSTHSLAISANACPLLFAAKRFTFEHRRECKDTFGSIGDTMGNNQHHLKTITPGNNTENIPAPMHRGWILAALMMTMMLAAMDNTIVSTAIPQIVGDLGGFSLFSWVFSIYLLIQTITIPLYGKLADMYGRKPVLITGTSIFLIGSATCALSWNMYSLIFFRGVQALGAGAIMATVNTLAGDMYSIRERAKIQGWLSSVWGVSAIAGPALGGAFAEYVSWHWIFLINLPVGAIAIILLYLFLHEKKPHIPHRIKLAGAALMLISSALLMFGILQGGQAWPWFSLNSILVFATAAILIFLTTRVERRNPEPLMPAWIWKNRVLIGANLTMIGMGITMMASSMYLPVYAQSVTGVGPIAAGFILASMSITWPLSSALSGKLYLTIGFRNTALAGACMAILGAGVFLLLPFPGPVWMLVGMQLLLGAGFGLISTPMLVGVQSIVTWNRRGVVTGANMFSRYFGQTLGAAIFAAVFNSVLLSSLHKAPALIAPKLPPPNQVIETLQSKNSSPQIQSFLRQIFHSATHYVYIALLITAVITLVIILFTPAKFPVLGNEQTREEG